MGSWQGLHDVWDRTAAPSVFWSLHSFLTWNCFHQRRSPATGHHQTQAGFISEQLKALEDSSLRTCSPAVWAAADSGSRSRSSSERAWADAKTAIGTEGRFGNDAYQLSIGLLREDASAGFAQVGTHGTSSAMS